MKSGSIFRFTQEDWPELEHCLVNIERSLSSEKVVLGLDLSHWEEASIELAKVVCKFAPVFYFRLEHWGAAAADLLEAFTDVKSLPFLHYVMGISLAHNPSLTLSGAPCLHPTSIDSLLAGHIGHVVLL
eukprot:jgi/Botrbrau1/13420/Bobra.0082s0026.1